MSAFEGTPNVFEYPQFTISIIDASSQHRCNLALYKIWFIVGILLAYIHPLLPIKLMQRPHSIQIHLLQKQSHITVDGVAQSLPGNILKLMIYIADRGETGYSRDELIDILFSTSTEDTDTYFRNTLYRLRERMPENLLTNQGKKLLRFAVEQVWVDSREFEEHANRLLANTANFGKQSYLEGQQTLASYKTAFLLDYLPKSKQVPEDARFVQWMNQRRTALALLYTQLLEQMIRFGLTEPAYWSDAQRYAEAWLKSGDNTSKPLQYLLWLTTKQGSGSATHYLAALAKREKQGNPNQGLSTEEWAYVLDRHIAIPLEQITEGQDGDSELVLVSQEEATDHPEVLSELIKLLTIPRKEQVLGLYGLPGTGKSEMTKRVIETMHKQHSDYRIVRLELTPQLDLEILCNNLLSQLGQTKSFQLDYAKKRQKLKQLLQAPNTVIIVDEGHSRHFADEETRKIVVELFAGAQIMLVGRELTNFEYYEVELPGLDTSKTHTFLTSRVVDLKNDGSIDFEMLNRMTRGLPLMLHLIVGGLKTHRGSMDGLIHTIRSEDDGTADVYTIYQRTLKWMWRYLTNDERLVLFAVSLFAPDEGVQLDVLNAVIARAVQANLSPLLRRLVEMRLIEPRDTETGKERYGLHPIIQTFVSKEIIKRRNKHTKLLHNGYVRYMLDFATTYHNQPERLDEHKQDILHMFDVVISDTDYREMQGEVVEALNLIYPYFEQRGLFARSASLFTTVRDKFAFPTAISHVQTLFHIGKIAKFRSRFDEALEAFQSALSYAEQARLSERYGALYFHIGHTYMENGKFNEAIPYFETAAQWAEVNKQFTLLYATWSNLASCQYGQSQFETAQDYYQKVANHLGNNLLRLPADLKAVAQHNQNALGLTAIQLGQYEEAKRYFQVSMEIARDLDYPELLGYLYLNLGVSYYHLKDYAAAHDCFTQSGMIANRIEHVPLQTEVTWNQGALASINFQHKDAFYLLRSALISAEKHQLIAIKPKILIALGKAFLRTHTYDSANTCFKQALLIQGISVGHSAEALYGIALSILMKNHLIGQEDEGETYQLLEPFLIVLPTTLIFSMAFNEIKNYLERAFSTFQRDLDHLPELARYRIVQVLEMWLQKTWVEGEHENRVG